MLTKTPGIVIAKTITIEQIKAPIRKNKKFLPTLIGLGLNKLHRVRTLEDTPSVRGMIRKVMHMVVIVDGDPFPEPPDLLKSFANDSVSRDTEISRRQPYIIKGVETKSEDGLDVEKFFEQADSNAIAAAKLGSALLSAAKGADALTGLTSIQKRGQFAAMARKLYLMMFSSDRVAAATAAYALISNSRSYGKGLDPETEIDQLPKREAATFYEGVRAILKKHDVNFVTSLTADKVAVAGNNATVKVHLTISKKLAFDIDGRKVIVGDDEPTRFGKNDLVIRCSFAKEPPILTVRPGDGIDVVVEATAEFVMDDDKTGMDLPIDIIAPDYEEFRRIPLGTTEHA